jgi:hypothetical protein
MCQGVRVGCQVSENVNGTNSRRVAATPNHSADQAGERMAILVGRGERKVYPTRITTVASAVLGLGATIGWAQPVSVEEVAKEVSTASLANNAATLMLYDLRCAPFADFDSAALKVEINKYAAVGAHKVGRDAFRILFLDELSQRRRQSEYVGVDTWCGSVGVQMRASGLETAVRSPAK